MANSKEVWSNDGVVGLDGKTYQMVFDEVAGFLTVSPIPTPDELNDFYENHFYADRPRFNDSSKEARDQDREYLNWGLSDVLAEYSSTTGRMPKDVLDVGCGFGHALDYFRDQGIQAWGYEPAPDAVAHCRKSGHQVRQGFAEPLLVSETRNFDLVTANHVLEHVPDPHDFLQLVAKVLRSDGLLYVQVPNDFSSLQVLARNSLGLNEWWLCPPNHLSYFTVASLSDILIANGFVVEALWADFPMEFFLLQGVDYVREPELGRKCHIQRVRFERSFRELGNAQLLRDFYRQLAGLGMGRELHVLARKA